MIESDFARYEPIQLNKDLYMTLCDLKGVHIMQYDSWTYAGKPRIFNDRALSSKIIKDTIIIIVNTSTEKQLKIKIADAREKMVEAGYDIPEKECKWKYLESTSNHSAYQAFLSYPANAHTRALLLREKRIKKFFIVYNGKCINALRSEYRTKKNKDQKSV